MTKNNENLTTKLGVNVLNIIKSESNSPEEFKLGFRDLLINLRSTYDEMTITNQKKSISDSLKNHDSLLKELAVIKNVKLYNDVKKNKVKKVKYNPKWEEEILVVNRYLLFDGETLTEQGVISEKNKVDEIMKNLSENYTSMRRGSSEDTTPLIDNAELNNEYKQPIPYMVISRNKELFVYERLTGSGESRLHNKLSLGVGGHMNPIDNFYDFKDVLKINLERELHEELTIKSESKELEYLGLINDDEDSTGLYHLGILGLIKLDDEAEVSVLEIDNLKGSWMTIDELKSKEVYDRLESWSKLTVDIL